MNIISISNVRTPMRRCNKKLNFRNFELPELVMKQIIHYFLFGFFLFISDINTSIGYADTNKSSELNGRVILQPFYDNLVHDEGSLYIAKKDNKFGWINLKGEVVIPIIYDEVRGFYANKTTAAVKIGGKNGSWGIIDVKGNFIVNPMYQEIYCNKHVCRAKLFVSKHEDDKTIYINNDGSLYEGDGKKAFAELDRLTSLIDRKLDKWGFAIPGQSDDDTSIKWKIPPIFDDAFPFYDGLSAVRIGDDTTGMWGFIDETGKFAINPRFDDVIIGFFDGLAAIAINQNGRKKYGFINKQGTIVIAPQYEEAHIFREGLAPVKFDTKWGYIDLTGKFIIKPQYDDAYVFINGIAVIVINKKFGLIKR